MPAVIEWPARISSPVQTSISAVSSDIFPTLAALTATPVSHNRPLDGINLVSLLDDDLESRPAPIFFWQFDTGHLSNQTAKPWIEPALQVGTTPLVKLMDGRATRNFRNFHHPKVTPEDYLGPRVMMDNQYKLVVHDGSNRPGSRVELFDLLSDPAEEVNLAGSRPETVESMQKELHAWQSSVLSSLMGNDYERK